MSDNKPLRYLLQVFNYIVFMALIAYFSVSPPIRLLTDDEAVITIAFAHAGELREPCRKLSSEELSELAQNMRASEACPRERSPVNIKTFLDGEIIYDVSLDPPGLFDDGGVDVFFSGKVPAGNHELEIKMNDTIREQGFNHSLSQSVTIEPGEILLVGFDKSKGFIVK